MTFRGSCQFDPKTVVGQLDARGQFRLIRIVVVVVGQMREEGPVRPRCRAAVNTSSRHMWVQCGSLAECVQDDHIHALQAIHRFPKGPPLQSLR